jgi:CheY-like chemotaxis protein
MNLVTNASEAIGERSGVISITTGAMECDPAYLERTFLDEELPEGLYVYMEVADTGSGMDEEVSARIFDPFFTTKFTGRGLGLAAVLGIVRGHLGAIKVYTEPGKGSTFKVLFPASVEVARPAPKQGPTAVPWQGEGTILLVDDDETVRAVGRRILEKLGFDVLIAVDGREAVQIFRQHRDDIRCVILDLTMPHMDGEETFRELHAAGPDIPVILSSGYNEQDVVHRFAGKGLAGFIQKPYQSASLVEKLRDVLGPSDGAVQN